MVDDAAAAEAPASAEPAGVEAAQADVSVPPPEAAAASSAQPPPAPLNPLPPASQHWPPGHPAGMPLRPPPGWPQAYIMPPPLFGLLPPPGAMYGMMPPPPGMLPGGHPPWLPPPPPYGAFPGMHSFRPPPPPPPPAPVKACPWLAHKDEAGDVYYHNTETGETSWDKPEGFTGDVSADKAPVPVSSRAVAECPDWAEVTCDDGRVYYFREEGAELSWSVPQPVTEARLKAEQEARARAAEAAAAAQAAAAAAAARAAQAYFAPPPSQQHAPVEEFEFDEEDATFTEEDIGGREAAAAKAAAAAAAAAAEAEAEAAAAREARQAAAEAKEHAAEAFRELLREKGVTAFTRWDAALPRLAVDKRYTAVAAHSQRRSLFDAYVKALAADKKKGGASAAQPASAGAPLAVAALRAAQDGFRALLEEYAVRRGGLSSRTTLAEVRAAAGSDPRWAATPAAEREALLAERLRGGHAGGAASAEARAAFAALLDDTPGLRDEAARGADWERAKHRVDDDDSRYRKLSRAERAAAFEAWAAAAGAAGRALAAREAAGRKRRADEADVLDRERRKAARLEAHTAYVTLLAEAIKEPDATWRDAAPRLERDPLGRGDPPVLDAAARESLFREHVAALAQRGAEAFREALRKRVRDDEETQAAQALGRGPLASWEDAEELMAADARTERCPAAQREPLWRAHVDMLMARRAANAPPPPPPPHAQLADDGDDELGEL